MKPPKDTVDATLKQIEIDSRHPTRKLAAARIRERRERATQYDFEKAPARLKAIMYGGTVRFKRRSLLSRLLWWR